MQTENETSKGSVFEATTFEGKVSYGNFEEPVSFVAHAGEDCRLVVDPLTVSAKTYVALSKAMGEPGSTAEPVTLSGESSDGISFVSPHMEIRGAGPGTDGHQIRLGTGEASISIPRKNDSKRPDFGVKLLLRGFKSFRTSPVEAKLGTVYVQSANKVASADEVSGAIIVTSNDDQPNESWYQDAEALAEFVWRGLQFGHGGRLHVPLIQIFRAQEEIATFYNGSGRHAHLPAIHFLDQSDFIAALVARFESDDPFPDEVWQTVGWLNNDSSVDEVRYQTLMTAVETILHSLVPDASSTLIPKTKFKPIRESFIQALAEFGLGQEETDVLVNNIKGINRAPMSRKLNAVIKKYNLPANVFDEGLIRRLNKQRNSITHQGKALDGESLWDCILYARELIALIVFAELRYKGRYQSYAEGYKQRTVE
ncbi:HEPN domain-containing protein [Ruegeria sp. HKCCA5491]|uniref:HEPN domain-containing protein n=1 Tax=Ruegeria sp. HKCCA5491 TaxID=2682986 RepID=UPI001487F188|nr:HEPN domain-containing protein [Ruegeria sp. HKCCA5491]